jgi:hypothetical protein
LAIEEFHYDNGMSFPGGISSNTHYGRFISGLGDGGHFVGGVATLSCALDALLKDDGFTPVQVVPNIH